MSYSTSNPPRCVARGIGASGSTWHYQSTDVHTDVDDTNYFSNGHALGMRVGDVVLVVETDNSYAQTTHSVISVTAGGAASISAAT